MDCYWMMQRGVGKGKAPGAALLALWMLLTFCFLPARVLAHPASAVPSTALAANAGFVATAPARPSDYADWPVVASIEQVGNNADESVEFTLEACTAMRIYAMGEVAAEGMQDYGTIENVATGQVIWRMYYFETESGGGSSLNRKVDRGISLPAGTYRLHYVSNAAHSFGDWLAAPPEGEFWGITLYEDRTPDRGPAVCWERARPEDLGWSSSELQQIVPELQRMNCAALMIVTDGKVVFEWGNTANNFFAHSVRKSLLSGLYGIYVAEGKIDLGKTLAELGIDEKTPLTEAERQATVADLLKARSGVYIPAAGEAASMRDSRPERHSHAPGTFWYYNNWDFNALGTIFDQETGEENIYTAFQRRIADPIGMQDFRIDNLRYTYESYSIHPYYGIRISARDLARFGQLFLQQGEWQGVEIIPATWVRESTYPYSSTGGSGTYSGYGYMWWIAARDFWGIEKGSYAASGYGGHTLEVLPSLNTVIVFRINTDDPTVELTSGAAVDQLILHILRASNRAADPYRRVVVLMLVWAALTVGALLVLLWDLLRVQTGPGRQIAWGSGLAWVLVTLLFGPLGLLAYLLGHRWSSRLPERPTPSWRRALGAAMYGATAYAIGWILVMACFFYLLPSRSPLVTLLISYALPFSLGLLLFQALPLAARLGGRYGLALRRGVLAETISWNLALAGMFPVGILLVDRWAPRPLEFVSLLFWGIVLLVALAGAAAIYLYKLWLAQRGHVVWPARRSNPGGSTGDVTGTPSLRDTWGALLLSVVLLIASIVAAALLMV